MVPASAPSVTTSLRGADAAAWPACRRRPGAAAAAAPRRRTRGAVDVGAESCGPRRRHEEPQQRHGGRTSPARRRARNPSGVLPEGGGADGDAVAVGERRLVDHPAVDRRAVGRAEVDERDPRRPSRRTSACRRETPVSVSRRSTSAPRPMTSDRRQPDDAAGLAAGHELEPAAGLLGWRPGAAVAAPSGPRRRRCGRGRRRFRGRRPSRTGPSPGRRTTSPTRRRARAPWRRARRRAVRRTAPGARSRSLPSSTT